MGGSLSEIEKAGTASVNLVVSSSGIAAAKELQKMFGTPYVVGIPYGKDCSKKLISDLKTAAQTGKSIVSYAGRAGAEHRKSPLSVKAWRQARLRLPSHSKREKARGFCARWNQRRSSFPQTA